MFLGEGAPRRVRSDRPFSKGFVVDVEAMIGIKIRLLQNPRVTSVGRTHGSP
jgi:hypothetical protein